MKRIAIMILAAACTLMFATGSFAEDRLSLKGQFTVMAWHQEGYTARDTQTFNDDDELDYIQQRFRTQATIKVADDVKLVTRFDIGEGDWGQEYGPGLIVRPSGGARNASKIDFDRAYIQIDKENWQLVAGQQYIGLGILQVLDSQPTAVKLVLKFDPAKLTLAYAKRDEGASLSDEGAANEDTDVYVANLSYDMDNLSLNLFGVTQVDDSPAAMEPTAVGIHAKTSMGAINLTGELVGWFGDTPAADYDGFQAYLGVDTSVSDALSVGGELFYAQGADTGDLQMTTFADFGSNDTMAEYTPVSGFISPGSLTGGSIYDFTGNMAGVIGASVRASYAAMEGLKVGGQFGYFTPEEDDNTNVDNAWGFNAWVAYMLATNTELSLTYIYMAPEADVGPDPDESTALALRLKLTF